MQEITIKIKESSLPEFLHILKSFEDIEIKTPKEEIMELLKRIDSKEEKLTPIDWDFYEKAIYASASECAISK